MKFSFVNIICWINNNMSFVIFTFYVIVVIIRSKHLPQNGIPSGVQVPFSHALRDGPSNSKPRSHEYEATDPWPNVSSVNVTVLWAGEPGNWHFFRAIKIKD